MTAFTSCPKCGSQDIYYNAKPQLSGGWITINKDSQMKETFSLKFLVCTNCYYIEQFVIDAAVEDIRSLRRWSALNPRKSKRKNDEE